MEKNVIETGVANATEKKVENANPLAKKVVPQNSKLAEKLIEKSKGKAKDAKASIGTREVVKGEKKAKAEKAPANPKLSVKIDELIAKGGKWEDLIAEANKFCAEQKLKTKINVASFKTQVYWRTKVQKNPDYLGNMELTEKGIFKAKAKKAA
jgi:hypothetical protein